jgi:hypothetical protein
MSTQTPMLAVVAGHEDAIRVVPVHGYRDLAALANAAPAPPAPQLTYRGGPLIEAVDVFAIYWGAAWQSGQLATLAQQLDGFFTTIVASQLIDQLGEYSVSGQTIGHGTFGGSATIATPAPPASVSDTALQQLLQHEISLNTDVPQPTPDRLYFLYLPPGVMVTQGGDRSCQAFCGYHNDISGQIFYAVMPYPGCAGCSGGLGAFDALTSTSSHELCEAITDPVPGLGWYDDTHGEIGDICAWQTRTLDGYTIQLEWSNAAGGCV